MRVRLLTPIFVVVVLALGLMALSVGAGSARVQAGHSCGPVRARTILEEDRVRLFGLSRDKGVFGCILPSSRPWKLGPYPEPGWAALLPIPFGINRPVAGGIELRQTGQDTAKQVTTVRNLLSGHRAASCFLGSTGPGAPRLRIQSVLVAISGSLIWGGARGHGNKEIGACESGAVRIIANSGGIDLASLRLRKGVLTWFEGGRRFSTVIR
jgi:hypothetical protein